MIARFVAGLTGACALFLLLSSNGYASELPLPAQPHLVVEGVGEVEQVPDVVTLTLDVSATAGNFSAAKQQVDQVIGKAIAAAKLQQVKVEDINASQIVAAPQYDWQNQQRIYRGEQVSRQLQVVLRKPDRYNDLVEGLLAAGVNRLQQVQFDFSNRGELEAKALVLALDNAQQQAATITAHLKTKVEKIYQVAPAGSFGGEGPFPMVAMESKRSSAPLALAKQKISQRVRVVYLLPQ